MRCAGLPAVPLALVHLFIALLCFAPRIKPPPPAHPIAYATLLYSEDFMNATRLNAHHHADFIVLLAQGWREPPISSGGRSALEALGCILKDVKTIPCPWLALTESLWGQFTKFRLWEQTQYEKIVYLDSDILVVRDISDLFDILHAPLAGVPDWDTFGKPSYRNELNGGVLVLRPNASLVPLMIEAAKRMRPSGTLEQAFLSHYFDWQTLPIAYNSPASLYLRNPSVWSVARVIHYTHAKPWQHTDPRFEIWNRGPHDMWYRAFEDMQRGYTYSPL